MDQNVTVEIVAETAATATPEVQSSLIFEADINSWLPDWLEPSWQFLAAYPVVLLPVLVIIAYLLGKTAQMVLSKGLQKLTSRTPTRFDDLLVKAVTQPVLPTMILLALMIGTATLGLPEFLHNLTIRLLLMILLYTWTRTAMHVAHIVLEILSRYRGRFELIQPRTMPAFDMVLKILVIGAAAYIFMLIWSINPTAWLASAGVLGIAIGFAAKDTLANFFSGIFIIADAPYKIGDYIVLDTGERGIVKSLGMRSTRLLTRDDIEITIPNAVIGNAKIINESGGPSEKERVRVPVSVAYGSDADEVCILLVQLALDHPEVVRDPEPRVRLRNLGASGLEFELLCWIDHPELRGKIVHDLNMNIYKGLRAGGIEIPFPQMDLHVRDMPAGTGTVRVANEGE